MILYSPSAYFVKVCSGSNISALGVRPARCSLQHAWYTSLDSSLMEGLWFVSVMHPAAMPAGKRGQYEYSKY